MLAVLVGAGAASVAAAKSAPAIAIAAAANLTYAVDALNAEFRRAAPDVTVTVTLGASGSLFAQMKNGAPFDVFLSADTEFPRQAVRAGIADTATLHVFAIGRLVLWTTRDDLDPTDIAAAVRNPLLAKIVIAQPKTAPYGRAAERALQALGVWDAARSKLVIGESIAQTAQFVDTGNADAGFVAMSFVLSPRLAHRGRWAEVPPSLYADVPLDHACVLTNRGTKNEAARQYVEFLLSPAAQRILEQHGYGVPRQQ